MQGLKTLAAMLKALQTAITTWPAASGPTDGNSLAGAIRGLYNNVYANANIGEADIDIDQADYTAYQNLIEIAPQGGKNLNDLQIVFDLDKTTTGFADGHAAETVQFAVARKVDGTNWRIDDSSGTPPTSGNNAVERALTLNIGSVGFDESVRVYVKLSAENAVDVEFPYAVYYGGLAAPTITAVAAA